MEGVIALMIPIVAFLVAGAAIIYNIRSSNRERMALIEKGIDTSSFYKKGSNGSSAGSVAKWGLFLVGIGIGLLVGSIIIESTSLPQVTTMFSTTLLFGGSGLLIFYFTIGKKSNNSI